MDRIKISKEEKGKLYGYLQTEYLTGTDENPTWVYVEQVHRSASGMSRDVRVFCVGQGRILNITWHVGHVCGFTLAEEKRGGRRVIRVKGCGFAVKDEIAESLQARRLPRLRHGALTTNTGSAGQSGRARRNPMIDAADWTEEDDRALLAIAQRLRDLSEAAGEYRWLADEADKEVAGIEAAVKAKNWSLLKHVIGQDAVTRWSEASPCDLLDDVKGEES